MNYWLLLLSFCLIPVAQAEPQSLDELLQAVRAEHRLSKEEDRARIAQFRDQQAERQRLLAEAKAARDAAKARNRTLQKQFEQQQSQLAALQTQLSERSRDMQPVFNAARQVAAELQAQLRDSLTSAQWPGRSEALGQLAAGKTLADLEALRGLWQSLLGEMVEGGKIQRFRAPVITPDGAESEADVLRIGVFSAVSEGRFLRYLPASERLVVLGRQPDSRYRALARDFQAASPPLVQEMAVDPSRGSLLSLLLQTPDWRERLHQGGMIGYIIIGLGALGLLLVLERFFMLHRLRRRIERQLKQTDAPQLDNPLGRILHVYQQQPNADTETLELKLDEAILREMPPLKRGLGSLGVLAGVAPLLGLLGTVTGIIHTFQAITLLGTGDPKLMSGGISEALVTTELGLLVAIPLLLLHSLLSATSNRLVHVLDEQSAALVARHAEAKGLRTT